MAKRLYVGNLSYSVTSEDVQELFEQYGPVRSAQVLIDRETGRSRGFGFVEMDGDADAEAAIEALDGKRLPGSPPDRERGQAQNPWRRRRWRWPRWIRRWRRLRWWWRWWIRRRPGL